MVRATLVVALCYKPWHRLRPMGNFLIIHKGLIEIIKPFFLVFCFHVVPLLRNIIAELHNLSSL